MNAWQLLESATVPGSGKTIGLFLRGGEFSIRVDGCELMNSRMHGSEEALAEQACPGLPAGARILIGGLGMGYTLAAALQRLGPAARVEMAELVPAVVVWNRGVLGDLAGQPLRDERVVVREVDVAQLLQTERGGYDAILLDVDNGPAGLTRPENDWLYTWEGLSAAFLALKPGGVLAVWSARSDERFTRRLGKAGFDVTEVSLRARGPHGGERHTIWQARKAGPPSRQRGEEIQRIFIIS
jgi:spermidine synthase